MDVFDLSDDFFRLWKRDHRSHKNSTGHSTSSTSSSIEGSDFDLGEFHRNGTEVFEESFDDRLVCSGGNRRPIPTPPLTPATSRQLSGVTIHGLDSRPQLNLPQRISDPKALKLWADILKITGRRNWDILCPFCRNNGEEPAFYRSHALKDADGHTTCPILRRYTCPKCRATGAEAHTISYCPLYDGYKRNNRKVGFDFGSPEPSQTRWARSPEPDSHFLYSPPGLRNALYSPPGPRTATPRPVQPRAPARPDRFISNPSSRFPSIPYSSNLYTLAETYSFNSS